VQQRGEDVADQAGDGLLSGDHEQDQHAEQLLVAEAAAPDVGVYEGGQQRIVLPGPAPADQRAEHLGHRPVRRDGQRRLVGHDRRRPHPYIRVQFPRHPQQFADDDQRQRHRQRLDKVDLRAAGQ
jgi:hypothetical protein